MADKKILVLPNYYYNYYLTIIKGRVVDAKDAVQHIHQTFD